jgi:hypothetical protein
MVSDLVSGEASPAMASEADSHRAGCPDCASELSLALSIERNLSSLPDHEPPAGLWAKLEARLDEADRDLAPQRATAPRRRTAPKLLRLPVRS